MPGGQRLALRLADLVDVYLAVAEIRNPGAASKPRFASIGREWRGCGCEHDHFQKLAPVQLCNLVHCRPFLRLLRSRFRMDQL